MSESQITDMDRSLFDLRAYLVLREAVTTDHLDRMNRVLKRTQYRFHNGHFMCGQINVLLARASGSAHAPPPQDRAPTEAWRREPRLRE